MGKRSWRSANYRFSKIIKIYEIKDRPKEVYFFYKINLYKSIYRAYSNFMNSGDLWYECINTVRKIETLDHIIFCNDILKIPPVKAFLRLHEGEFCNLTDTEKKALGAFWAFIFKEVLGYQEKKNVSISTCSVKTSAYYLNPKNEFLLKNIT